MASRVFDGEHTSELAFDSVATEGGVRGSYLIGPLRRALDVEYNIADMNLFECRIEWIHAINLKTFIAYNFRAF